MTLRDDINYFKEQQRRAKKADSERLSRRSPGPLKYDAPKRRR